MYKAGTAYITIKSEIDDNGTLQVKNNLPATSTSLSNNEAYILEFEVTASGSQTITLSDFGASNSVLVFFEAERAMDIDLNGSATKGYAQAGYIGTGCSISSITFDETSGSTTNVKLIIGS